MNDLESAEHKQDCCNKQMIVTDSYIGKVYKHWNLYCEVCNKQYAYGTYKFEIKDE